MCDMTQCISRALGEEPYIHSKEPYEHSKEPYRHSKEPHIKRCKEFVGFVCVVHSNSTCYDTYTLKSPTNTQKSPTNTQKSPTDTQKSPT